MRLKLFAPAPLRPPGRAHPITPTVPHGAPFGCTNVHAQTSPSCRVCARSFIAGSGMFAYDDLSEGCKALRDVAEAAQKGDIAARPS